MSANRRDVVVMVCFTLTACALMVGAGQLWLAAKDAWQSGNPWIYLPAGAVLVVGAIVGFFFTIFMTIFMETTPGDKPSPDKKNDQSPSA